MKTFKLLPALVASLLLANVLSAVQSTPKTRGIWVWGQNYRHREYRDATGFYRYSGTASVRIYQSWAADNVDFELDWEWGVVFSLSGWPYGEGPQQELIYVNQPWYRKTFLAEEVTEQWLPEHYCQWAEPSVFGDADRLFHPPYVGEETRDEETTHFSGTYHFP